MIWILPTIFLLPFFLSGDLSGEERLYTFPPIQVVGERTVPPSVTILTHEEIQESGVEDLGEILQGVDGVFVKAYGGSSGLKTLSLRGYSPEEVLILLDGVPLNSPQSGLVDLSTIPLQSVERIEVYRGGRSSWFGGSAMGGVVNIVTETHESHPRTSIQSTLGSFDFRLLTLSRSEKKNRWGYSLSLQGEDGRNNFSYSDGFQERIRENGDHSLFDFFSTIGVDPNPTSNLTLSYHHSTGDQGDPGSLTIPTPGARREDRQDLSRIQYENQVRENWRLNAHLYVEDTREVYESPEIPYFIHGEHETFRSGAKVEQEHLLVGGNRIQWNLNASLENLESNQVGRRRRESGGLSLRSEFRPSLLSGLSLIPSFRLDHYSSKERVISPQFEIHWTKRAISLFGSVGESYRPPTFNELYWPDEVFASGNSDLGPERAFQLDGGFSCSIFEGEGETSFFSKGEVRLNPFWHRIEDQILWLQGEDRKSIPQNLGLVENRGVEGGVDLRFEISDFRMMNSVNYAYLSSIDRSGDPITDGKQLVYRPIHSANHSTNLEYKNLNLNLANHYVGERPSLPSNDKWLPYYFLTDLSLSYEPILGFANGVFKTGIRNLFDQRYEVIRFYPQPGREWRFSMGVEF